MRPLCAPGRADDAPACSSSKTDVPFVVRSYGAPGETFGEAVFCTAMTGYQETLTDPSYHRQVVVQTSPHIGNTGVNDEDPESPRIWVSGYVVRDPARRPSNWRATATLDDELRRQDVVGISGIDTRALTRHLARTRCDARRHLNVKPPNAGDAAWTRVRSSPAMEGADLTAQVTTSEPYVVPAVGERRFTVAAIDLGIKAMTPRRMAERGIEVHVAPSSTNGEQIEALGADGVFFSNGPGDPATADEAVGLMRDGVAQRDADVRHLLRQPGSRSSAWLRYVQAQVRPPRDQSTGTRPVDRQGRGVRTQPRLCGRCADRRRNRHRVWSSRGQPRLSERQRRRGPAAARRTGVQRAVPPRGGGWSARLRVLVRSVLRPDGVKGGALMPRRTDLTSVMVIGSGPIVIGQAAEFDYSGTQACRVLRDEGLRVILVNSNPATIMTDPEFADATYVEPITPEIVEKIIAKERPDALLPDPGRTDRTQRGHRAARVGSARQVRRRADRRERRCDPTR